MREVHILMTNPLHELAMGRLAEQFILTRLWEIDRSLLREIEPHVLGIATGASYGRIDAVLFNRLPNLQIVATIGVGYEHIDCVEAVRRGILVTNTPVLTDEVADLAIGLLLATLRRLPQADRFVRQGQWLERSFPVSPTLRGRTVGILGLGRIGKAVARRLIGFDIPVHYYGRRPQLESRLPYHASPVALAEAVDVLIVTTVGGESTRHLVDAGVLRALGPDGVLINVARGSVVDEQALVEALATRTILSAGLDVFEDEPCVPQALIDMEQIVLLPHVGSASDRTRRDMAKLTVDNLESWFAGKGPLTPVLETPWPPLSRLGEGIGETSRVLPSPFRSS